MGILDEAIREHLELKRQHGAADSELQKLEDEAFGQAERPGEASLDAPAEAPTQFMEPEGGVASKRRERQIADLQEPPPPPVPEPPAAEETGGAGQASAGEEPSPPAPEAPAAEEQSAMEHEVVADVPAADPEPPAPPEEGEDSAAAGHSTEERQAIAEQPTEMYDVEEELAAPPRPSDEQIVEEEIAEPRLAPTDPLAGLEETEEAEPRIQGPAPDDDDYEDEDDAFWNEQRLSDELDQALEAPVGEPEPEPEEPEPEYEEEEDLEEDEDLEEEDEPEPLAQAAGEASHSDDDVLEETPEFLEESPEDDQLWFEQKPPKDFDFDD